MPKVLCGCGEVALFGDPHDRCLKCAEADPTSEHMNEWKQRVYQVRLLDSRTDFDRVDFVLRGASNAFFADNFGEARFLAQRAWQVAIECLVRSFDDLVCSITASGRDPWQEVERDFFDVLFFYRRGKYDQVLRIFEDGRGFRAALVQAQNEAASFSTIETEAKPKQAKRPNRRERRRERREQESNLDRVLKFSGLVEAI